jgi:hypothetical protein
MRTVNRRPSRAPSGFSTAASFCFASRASSAVPGGAYRLASQSQCRLQARRWSLIQVFFATPSHAVVITRSVFVSCCRAGPGGCLRRSISFNAESPIGCKYQAITSNCIWGEHPISHSLHHFDSFTSLASH